LLEKRWIVRARDALKQIDLYCRFSIPHPKFLNPAILARHSTRQQPWISANSPLPGHIQIGS
jgi:hypothetical protein